MPRTTTHIKATRSPGRIASRFAPALKPGLATPRGFRLGRGLFRLAPPLLLLAAVAACSGGSSDDSDKDEEIDTTEDETTTTSTSTVTEDDDSATASPGDVLDRSALVRRLDRLVSGTDAHLLRSGFIVDDMPGELSADALDRRLRSTRESLRAMRPVESDTGEPR